MLKPAAGNTKVSALSKPLGDRKIIYHYTSAHALLQIFKSGFIKTTDSLLGLTGSTRIELHHETDERFPRIRVPYVVWLTDLTFFDTPHMLENHVHDKTEVRVVVGKTPEYIRADKWYKENGATDDGIKVLEETADSSTSTWYVLERGLLVDEFIRIEYVNINPQDISMRHWQELDMKKFKDGYYTHSKNQNPINKYNELREEQREHDTLLSDIDAHLGID